MKLTKNARILTIEGQDIGNLNRFVIDPRTRQVSHIVFDTGASTNRERLIPMPLIDFVDDQGIHLKELPVERLDDLQIFAEEQYLVSNESALMEKGYLSDDLIDSYYYYPNAGPGGSGMLRPANMYIFNPPESAPMTTQSGIPVTGEQPVIRQADDNIPEGTVALKEGAKVISRDGKHIGNIEKVVVDQESARATHLLITKGLLLKEHKAIPAEWIDDASEDKVVLSVDHALTDRLPDYGNWE